MAGLKDIGPSHLRATASVWCGLLQQVVKIATGLELFQELLEAVSAPTRISRCETSS